MENNKELNDLAVLFDLTVMAKTFREKYNVDVTAMPTGYNDLYFYEVRKDKKDLFVGQEEYKTYEEALKEGIKYAEENIILNYENER